MKKILVTGVTSVGAKDRPKEKRKIATTVYAVVDCLREYGCEVEQRPVEPGEDLGKFDKLILIPATLGGFASGYLLQAMYAATWGLPTYLLLDDWQCAKIVPSLRGFLKNVDKNWKKHQLFNRLEEWLTYRKQIDDGIADLCETWTLPIMAPTFGGGGAISDLGISHEGPQLLFDPSIHFDKMYKVEMSPIREGWVCTSLTDRSKWTRCLKELDWEIKEFGCKARGQVRLKECELVGVEYSRSLGVLSPPTGLKSGCWWRARYQHAIEAGCVLAGERDETKFIGPSYSLSPQEIEKLDHVDLYRLVSLQRDEYYAMRWDKQRLVDELTNFLFTRK